MAVVSYSCHRFIIHLLSSFQEILKKDQLFKKSGLQFQITLILQQTNQKNEQQK